MTRHSCRLVVEDNVGDVLAVLDRIGNRRHTAVEERRVPHEHELLVSDKRIDSRAGPASEPHA